MDGVRCLLGATHQARQPMPWATSSTAETVPAVSFPWTAQPDLSELFGQTATGEQSCTPWKPAS